MYAENQTVKLHYQTTGTGEPLLLIMGLGMDHRGWMMQTPQLAQDFTVITYDNRGVGRSSVPPGPYTTLQMAEDAAFLLDHLGIASAHVCGISMGGMIAQQLAIHFPKKVKKLVLSVTYGWVDDEIKATSGKVMQSITGQQGGDPLTADLSQVNMEKVLFGMMEYVFTPTFLDQNRPLLEAFYQEFLREAPSLDGFLHQLVATQTHDTRDQLEKIACPTLVLGADRDMLIPPSCSKKIADKIPGAELVFMEGVGHALNFEKAGEFNRILADFLKG